jgi:TPR repeat protein
MLLFVDLLKADYWYTRAKDAGHKGSAFRLKSLRGKNKEQYFYIYYLSLHKNIFIIDIIDII